METVKEDRLQKTFIEVNKMFSEYEFDKYMIGNEATFNKFVMDNINGMCWNMHSWVWARKPDRKEVIIGSYTHPDGWFQMLKWEVHSKLIRYKRFEVIAKLIEPKLKHVVIKREIDLQTFYPTMRILNHEPYLNVVEVNNASEGIDRYTEEV